jgi:imidazolonepropionase-like amidohydrolase
MKRIACTLALMLMVCARSTEAQVIAIRGGKVFPVSGPPIENGTVVITNGRISAVGANVAIPANARVIDATGKWVTPGLINAATQLGVSEIGQVDETVDAAATGKDNIAAAFTVWDGFNPGSVLLAPARQEGVTSFVIVPRGGLVSGQAAFVDLVNGTTTDMVLRAPVAMHAQMGVTSAAGVGARGELIVKLRELLTDARWFMTHRADFDRAQSRTLSASRADLEALIPIMQRRQPLVIAADRVSDIDGALKLATDFNLRIIIAGGAEAWLMGDRLARAGIPVMTGAMSNIPFNFSQLGVRQENAGLLRRAGVNVTLIGNGPGDPGTFNVSNIRQEAGNAVAYGMSWDDALRAVTLAPAELFSVADQVGTLQPGRRANIVVWNGDPFEFATRAEHVFVHGVEYQDVTRQDLLTRRYMNPGR